jgi:hypothetical protein
MIAIFACLAVAAALVICLSVTTPTSYYGRLTGTEAWPDPITFTGGFTAPASAVQIQGYGLVTVPAATTTLTLTPALHAGKVVLVQSTGGLAITPPAATGTGNVYRIYVFTAISGGSLTIDPKAGNASDVCAGSLYGGTTGAAGSVWVTATNSNFITFNATTTGGLAGTWVEMTDVATNKWAVQGVVVSSGTAATPFSNH